MKANLHVRTNRCTDAVASDSIRYGLFRSTEVDPMHAFPEIQSNQTDRGRYESAGQPSMRAVQIDPRTKPKIGPKTNPWKDPKINPRTRPRNDPKIEERSSIDTDPKDWTLERADRSRFGPSFGPADWHDRMKTSNRP
jgi:hypothetical protein